MRQASLAFFPKCGKMALMLTKRVKSRIIKDNQRHEKDTGSAEVQVSVITRQMQELADHLKKNPKDNHSRRGLLKMVSQRRRLLAYLLKSEPETHQKVMKKLEAKK
jgi:small subunit ribosomal protein S15